MPLQGYPVDGALDGRVQQLRDEGDGADAGKHGGFRKAPSHDEGQGREHAAEQDDLPEGRLVAVGDPEPLEGVAQGKSNVPRAFTGVKAFEKLHGQIQTPAPALQKAPRRGAFLPGRDG